MTTAARLLLDTHVVLWWLMDSPRLSAAAREAIAAPQSEVYVSAAALWEIAIKKGLGRLECPPNLLELLRADAFEFLAITPAHALAVAALPQHHSDPFDRLHLVQALHEELTIVTADPAIATYGAAVLAA